MCVEHWCICTGYERTELNAVIVDSVISSSLLTLHVCNMNMCEIAIIIDRINVSVNKIIGSCFSPLIH